MLSQAQLMVACHLTQRLFALPEMLVGPPPLQMPERTTPRHLQGAKGIGEIGIVGTAAAIANAVYQATGISIRDLPIALDKLLP